MIKILKELYHYILISRSDIFDRHYYLKTYDDVRNSNMNPLWHFLTVGWKEGRNPSSTFDINYYLENNPDVEKDGINPIIHYIKFGKKERRTTVSTKNSKKIQYHVNQKTDKTIIPDNLKNKVSINNALDNQSIVSQTTSIGSPKKSENATIFVHVGQPKTGTSSLQLFLDANRQKLVHEHGCLYPNFFSNNLISGSCYNHHRWYQSIMNNDRLLLNDINKLEEQLSSNPTIDKVVFSSEGWFHDKNVVKIFKKIIQNNKNCQLMVIVYLRRIDSFVESAWKQWGLKEYESIDKYYNQPRFSNMHKNSLEYLENWSGLVGRENVIVRPYEKQQLTHGLHQDFFRIIGIDYLSNNWETVENESQSSNTGFNRDVLEILHYCRSLYTDVHDNHLFDLFNNLLGDNFRKKPFESYALLSPKQRFQILNINQPYERQIAKKYLDRPDGKIFYDPWPDPNKPWEPYQGLSLERALPIIIKMIDQNHKIAKNVKR